MKKIVIVGAGGFGREVQWLIERINSNKPTWDIVGYIDDNLEVGTLVDGIEVIGDIEYLEKYDEKLSVVCAVGASVVRKNIIERIKNNLNIEFPILVDPDSIVSDRVEIKQGCIICAGTIITMDITINEFVIVNLDCTIGHDAVLDNYVTVYPGVRISGNTFIGQCSELGTGMQIIQGKSIGEYTIVGAGAVVVKNIQSKCTAVGNPARIIKTFD